MKRAIYEDNVNGLKVLVRYPEDEDAPAMCKYINKLSSEQTYITLQGEEISLESEEKYLKNQLEKFDKAKAVQLLLFVDNKLLGISGIELQDKIKSHIGGFGISIAEEVRGKGLGKLLMKLVLAESKKLLDFKIITLEVFAENERAIKMYKNYGFVEYGRLPGGNKYKGQFVDDISMYKSV